MRLKFISPFKADLPPNMEPVQNRRLRELEEEGLLKGIDWDLDEGIPGPIVENREELAQVVPGVLRLVRQACESGKYDAIIIIGGLEPGLYAAREIATEFNIPVVGCTSSQVAFAYLLGHKYTIIDTLEGMAITIRQNMMAYGMNEKCASVRSIEWSCKDLIYDAPGAVEAFVREAVEAVEQDGADVIVIGCAALMYIQPLAQKKLKELGYDVPILHPFKCAIEMAKALVNMKVSQSRFAYPSKNPKKRAIPR